MRVVSLAGVSVSKASGLNHYQNGKDRITSPLRRRTDGSFEEIDWDTATREIMERFAAIRDTHGGDKIFITAVAVRAIIYLARTPVPRARC